MFRPAAQAFSSVFKSSRLRSSSAKASCAFWATLMIVVQLIGNSSDRSCKSILAWVALADSFLISVFRVSRSLMSASIVRHVGEFLDHLDAAVDVFVALGGELGEIVEAEAMDIAQLLVNDDQPPADQHHAAKAFVMHLQHRLDHHPRRLLDRERDRVEEQLQPPDRIRVGIAYDRQGPALLLVQDVRLEQIEIALALPGAVAVLGAPDLDELPDKGRVERAIGLN